MNYVRKIDTGNLPAALKSMQAIFIWGSDGWCYIPQLKIRQKFTEKKYFMEEWDGIVPIPCHHEKMEWALISDKPRIWKEGSDVFYLSK
jgi:hypothetical protein